jgi:hypothetical protein
LVITFEGQRIEVLHVWCKGSADDVFTRTGTFADSLLGSLDIGGK